MTKLLALKLLATATLASATLTACAMETDAPVARAGCALTTCQSSTFTLDGTEFLQDGSRWLSDASGPLLSGNLLVTHAIPHASINGKPVGAPAIVRDGRWEIQLPDGTLTSRDARVSIAIDVAKGEPEIIEQTFALAE